MLSVSAVLSPQACFKQILLLAFILSCFVGRSCGFQVSPAFRKRRNHYLQHDYVMVKSLQPSAASLLRLESNDATCMSGMALRNSRTSSFHPLIFHQSLFDTAPGEKSQQSPLFRHSDETRLYAAPSGNDKSPTSSKLRSILSKVYKAIASPVVSYF